jgi:aerobic carbon-monoxide dehydrogenase large subunit
MNSRDLRKGVLGQPEEMGAGRLRIEDEALVSGRGAFVDDRAPAGCLHMAFTRSPLARASIRSLDVRAARSVPGVVAVFSGADLSGIGPLPVNGAMFPIASPGRPVLAHRDVRFVGEPYAAIVANTVLAAREAADLVEAGFEAEAPDVDPRCASKEAFSHRWLSGDPQTAFADAAHVVQARIVQPRVAAVPLEPRGILADWDHAGDTLTVWVSSQTPHRTRTDLAQLLGIPASHVRAIAADVGGAFGSKASIYPEEVTAAWAARALKRPVKWIATRNEDLLSATHGRGGVLEGELAFNANGALLGLRARIAFPLGAWLPYSAAVPAWNAGRILPGPYAVRNVDVSIRGVLTDTAPLGIYRGAGRPEAAVLMERLIDEAATKLGQDPAILRRNNLIAPDALPYLTPTGQTLDSADYPRLLEKALQVIDYETLHAERAARRAAGHLYGIGIGFYVEPCGRGRESASVLWQADGTVIVASGTSAQGQGHGTALAQIAASTLGVRFEDVRVVEGDTHQTPPGIGALASRSIAIGGSAVLEAARQVRQCRERADPLPIECTVDYEAPGEAWSSGCCVAAVSVDRETGEPAVERFAFADDAGRLVNPLLAEGQLVGGFAQGVGQALMEALVHDPDGQLLTGSLMDYAVPRAMDVPALQVDGIESVSTANALGAKGVGESGAIGVPAALLNAFQDALSSARSPLQFPLTSEKLWRAIQRMENRS